MVTTLSHDRLADGWLEHDGTSDPCPGRGLVPVILRDGRESWSRFGYWHWGALTTNIDIVAYRPDDPERMELAA